MNTTCIVVLALACAVASIIGVMISYLLYTILWISSQRRIYLHIKKRKPSLAWPADARLSNSYRSSNCVFALYLYGLGSCNDPTLVTLRRQYLRRDIVLLRLSRVWLGMASVIVGVALVYAIWLKCGVCRLVVIPLLVGFMVWLYAKLNRSISRSVRVNEKARQRCCCRSGS